MSDFMELIDLAAERLGGVVMAANDEFFAPKENLLKGTKPVWIEDKYTDVGKWMDGWESRRKRTPGFDWCIVRLGLPGMVRGVVVDTSFFTGNFPEKCSLEACEVSGHPDVETLTDKGTKWQEILPQSALKGDAQNPFAISHSERVTHLRLNIFPDGGVARLRVYGEAVPDWEALKRAGGRVDLAAAENGGLVVACSDMFYGSRHNLIWPGRGLGMHDGWETKRRRGPGYDWAVIQLGAAGSIEQIEVDTGHYKGNFPESCSVEVCAAKGKDWAAAAWKEILPRTKLQAHTRHLFEKEIAAAGAATHARLNIYPDGGVSRLRMWGRLAIK